MRRWRKRWRGEGRKGKGMRPEGNMDMRHSKRYSSFMQPVCDCCPICTPHADRIMIATTATHMSISITPYDTHTFLGKSKEVLESSTAPRTVKGLIELSITRGEGKFVSFN